MEADRDFGADRATSRIPPFRIIAIVPTIERAWRVLETIAALDGARPIGLMIRDPQHDEERVRAMVEVIAAELMSGVQTSGVQPFGAQASGSRSGGVHLIANGIALAAAAFVHLPFAQAAAGPVLAGMGYRVGASVHSLEEAVELDRTVDYLIASPVFPTVSKPGHRGIRLEGLGAICAAVAAPVFALGGMTATTAPRCLEHGAYGVAAISAFDDPTSARALVDAVEHSIATTSGSHNAARR